MRRVRQNLGRESIGEREVKAFLRSTTDVPLVANDSHLLGGLELDAYLPDLNIGVEFNGDYWHSHKQKVAEGKPSAYEFHRMKRDLAANRGVKLAFVWEYDWKNRRTEVESALRLLVEEGMLLPVLRRLSPEDDPFELGLFALNVAH